MIDGSTSAEGNSIQGEEEEKLWATEWVGCERKYSWRERERERECVVLWQRRERRREEEEEESEINIYFLILFLWTVK